MHSSLEEGTLPNPTITAHYPDLAGQSVLVTGGASGIGAAIVAHFAAQGARVSFLDRAADAAKTLCSAIAAQGWPEPLFLPCDLRDILELREAIAEIARHLGAPSVLINNAANDERHRLEDVTPDYWDERFQVNLRHQFFAAQAVAPGMRARTGGAIVNLGSTSWLAGQGGMPAYLTAKSAISGLTRALARDLGVDNIRVNSIIPGWIMTKRQRDLWLTPESERELLAKQCLKRKLTAADVARVVLFFAAAASGGCTSQNYIVDAGWI